MNGCGPGGLAQCLFAVRLAKPDSRGTVEDRARHLARFYRPVGEAEVTLHYEPTLSLVYGSIAVAPLERQRDGLLCWGGFLPPGYDRPENLLEASDLELRGLDTVLGAMAVTPGGGCLVSSTVLGPCFYTANSPQAEVWATHAVAAAVLATGQARVDPSGLPELLTIGAVAGDRTFIEGVTAVPDATRIEVGRDGVSKRSYWARTARWERVPEEQAYSHTEAALLSSLERRTRSGGRLSLGLTGGLDSRVVGVALKLLEVDFRTHTWGGGDHPDVAEAERVAERLGAPHQRLSHELQDDETALASVDREARWSDGHAPAGFLRHAWPPEFFGARLLTGHGGGVGKAFYYRSRPARDREPDTRSLARTLAFEASLRGVRRDARARFRARVAEWIAEAEAVGCRGWRCLDIVYAEQRARRWGRAGLPRAPEALFQAFSTPDVMRGLTSLSLDDRLHDGFHRRFLDAHRPAVGAPSSQVQPGRLRQRRRLVRPALAPMARPVRRRLARNPGARAPWFAARAWDDRPELRAWLMDEVLTSTVVDEGLGERWARRVRSEFLRDERSSTRQVLSIAGVVALQKAVDESDHLDGWTEHG